MSDLVKLQDHEATMLLRIRHQLAMARDPELLEMLRQLERILSEQMGVPSIQEAEQ